MAQQLWKTVSQVLKILNLYLPKPQKLQLENVLKTNKDICLHKDLHVSAHSSSIYTSSKVGLTQMPASSWTHEWNVIFLCSTAWIGTKKDQVSDTYNRLDRYSGSHKRPQIASFYLHKITKISHSPMREAMVGLGPWCEWVLTPKWTWGSWEAEKWWECPQIRLQW